MNALELLPAPPALHRGDGRPAVDGRYAGAIADLDTAVWDSRGLLSRRRWQRKGWLYLGTVTERHLVGLALVDAGWIATAFVYVYDRHRGDYREQKLALPFGFAEGFAPDWRGNWQLGRGGRQWQVRYESGGWTVAVDAGEIRCHLRVEDHGRGLTAISAPPGRPFHHTYKLAGLRASGTLSVGGETLAVAGRSNLDFSLGYPPRETLWNWASLDGLGDDGQPVAINLVAHFMNGLENAIWAGDTLGALPQAVFEVPPDRLAPWTIRTVDGALNLQFIPDGQRAESLRLGLMRSVFQQPFGRFEGLWYSQGRRRRLQGYGVVEHHLARW